jgi:hypothetical protein
VSWLPTSVAGRRAMSLVVGVLLRELDGRPRVLFVAEHSVPTDDRLGLGGGLGRWWSPAWVIGLIVSSSGSISSRWLELRWWRNPPPR